MDSNNPRERPGQPSTLIPSIILCAVWALPDLWAAPLSLPAGEISSMGIAKLLTVLAWPAMGVIGFAVWFLPLPPRWKGVVIILSAAGGVFLGTCLEEAFLPASGRYFFAGFLAAWGLSFVAWRFQKRTISRALLGILPVGILAFHFLAVAKGEYPWAFFGPVKTAVNLGACGWLVAAGFREWSRK